MLHQMWFSVTSTDPYATIGTSDGTVYGVRTARTRLICNTYNDRVQFYLGWAEDVHKLCVFALFARCGIHTHRAGQNDSLHFPVRLSITSLLHWHSTSARAPPGITFSAGYDELESRTGHIRCGEKRHRRIREMQMVVLALTHTGIARRRYSHQHQLRLCFTSN